MKPVLIDCSFDPLSGFNSPQQAISAHAAGFGYAKYLQQKIKVTIIEQINYEGEVTSEEVQYHFFKYRKRLFHLPFKMIRFIKKSHPTILFIQGLIFPLEVIILRWMLNKKIIFITQHHGEIPGRGIKKIFQKIADGYIQAYVFTSLDNAKPWVNRKIIHGYHKCYEVLEASTFFKKQNRQKSKLRLGVKDDYNFLWVGRLNANKDPVAMLAAFEDYLNQEPDAKLYMIYQDETLLRDLKMILETNQTMRNAVFLLGKIPHDELPYWYSAIDFYVSCSHREGSGFALIEAMACGCIPVVTNIPSFRKITANGKYGFLFEPGNVDELSRILQSLKEVNRCELSEAILQYFSEELSFQRIADQLYTICERMMAK
ncbi:MAG: glycosyltransferase family 4 protein [Chitinophagaceae bacterium]